MSMFQIVIVLAVFAAVILAIALNVIDMAVAALTGVCALIALGILDDDDIGRAFSSSAGPLSLLFGGMIVARVLRTTGLFDLLCDFYLRATAGSGKRFLLVLIAVVVPLCAFLPNATTVVLLAPVIVRVARSLEIEPVEPLILTAIVSNSAGLLTLVGDPATFLVGSAIGMTFGDYLQRVSVAGLLAILVIVPLLPHLMGQLWRTRCPLPQGLARTRIERPVYAGTALAILVTMVLLFVFGEDLPARIMPPAVALIAGALALLVGYAARVEPTDDVLRDVDWKTLIFLASIFCLVQAVIKTGLLQFMALRLYSVFGAHLTPVALVLIASIALLSSMLANVPVAAASIVMIKGYLVVAQVVPEEALSAQYTQWPVHVLPVFISMMFGATLGGNATLIGASANIVAAGVCAREGTPVTFGRFMRYGLPITLCQLCVAALYVLLLTLMR